MRDNLICIASSDALPIPPMLLNDLPNGAHAVVTRVHAAPGLDAAAARRLGELGFIAGEAVQLLRRGPGGREPLAVLVGDTLFALRALEAQSIEVQAGTGSSVS